MRANLYEAGKTVRSRHAEIEQQQIDFRVCMQRREQGVDGVGFEGAGTGECLGDGELQRFAKQRVIVGDEDGG